MSPRSRAKPKPTHAGAIAVRITAGAPHVLLVTAKRDRHRWVLPKGHIERGETAAQAAVRELEEEGGVRGEALTHVGTLRLGGSKKPVVAYFLARVLEEPGSDERRRRRWCTLDDALRRLSHEDARELLRRTWALLDEHLR